MRDHPIPQDVVGYKFHIVGNMTLKQFAEVAAGVIVAVILYNTNLIGPIKWTLIVLSAASGALIAFVPIEERPLDHWITTFFSRIYNPTKFYWRKETEIPFAFTHQRREKTAEEEAFEIDLTPARRARIKEYMESVRSSQETDSWETEESAKLADILSQYESVEVKNISSTPLKIKPQLTTRIRSLSKASPQIDNALPDKHPEKVVFQSPPVEEAILTPASEAPPESIIESASLPVTDVEPVVATVPVSQQNILTSAPLTDVSSQLQPTNSNAKLPFPEQPSRPNVLSGMVLTQDNKLIDQVTIRLKNAQGQVLHAFRTNLLGQFTASTAFPNGTYIISAEKPPFTFTEQTITLNGSIVVPLEIRAS